MEPYQTELGPVYVSVVGQATQNMHYNVFIGAMLARMYATFF